MEVIQILKRNLSHFLTWSLWGILIANIKKSVNFHGAEVNISNPNMPNRVKAAVFWNIYESAEARLLKKWLPANIPVVELGASLGIISKLIRSISREPMYCVEANPSVIPSIQFNLNSVTDSKHLIIQKAIHYDSDDVLFNWSSGENLTGRIDPRGTERVECIKLSTILEENQLKNIVLVMDIEGAEIQIIRNDELALQKCVMIFAELHATSYQGNSYTVEEINNLIQDKGFHLLAKDGNCFAFSRTESYI